MYLGAHPWMWCSASSNDPKPDLEIHCQSPAKVPFAASNPAQESMMFSAANVMLSIHPSTKR